MKRLFVFCVAIALSGCARTTYEPLVTSKTVIDTVMQTVCDSSVLYALLECDSLNRVRVRELASLHGKTADAQLNIDGGKIEYKTRWQTKYIDREIVRSDTITRVELKEVVREVKHVPRFYKICFWIALSAIGFNILRLLRRFV